MVLTGEVEIPDFWPNDIKEELKEVLAKQPYPTTLPVKVFRELTQEQRYAFFFIKHESGQKRWPSIQRGMLLYDAMSQLSDIDLVCKHVDDLRRVWKSLSHPQHNEALKKIAAAAGKKRPDHLRWYIMAYVATATYCTLYQVKEKDQEGLFTYFLKLYNKSWFRSVMDGNGYQKKDKDGKKVIVSLDGDPSIEQKFMQWMADGRFNDTCQVDILHYLMTDQEAFKVFLEVPPVANNEKDDVRSAFDIANEVYESKRRGYSFGNAIVEIQSLDAKNLKLPEYADIRTQLKQLKGAILLLESDLGENV